MYIVNFCLDMILRNNKCLWWTPNSNEVKFLNSFKVIPLFCTAQPLLRITLRHPRWRQFFPLTWEGQTRAAFAELKLSFVIKMPQIGWQLPGQRSKKKKMRKMCHFVSRSSPQRANSPSWQRYQILVHLSSQFVRKEARWPPIFFSSIS